MIEGKKFLGWHLESFSLDHELFTLTLVLRSFGSREEMGRALDSSKAKIVFISPRRITFDNVHSGAEVSLVEYRIVHSSAECTLSFAPNSSIMVAAADSRELIF